MTKKYTVVSQLRWEKIYVKNFECNSFDELLMLLCNDDVLVQDLVPELFICCGWEVESEKEKYLAHYAPDGNREKLFKKLQEKIFEMMKRDEIKIFTEDEIENGVIIDN